MKIEHKFKDHKISNETKILIIGTFNPNVSKNEATFFYGRSKNFLWSLLPEVFGEESLKNKNTKLKLNFMNIYKIDFVDLISKIEVEPGEENNYSDDYIDDKVSKWKNIINLIKKKPIQEVYFTRKTFSKKVKNIKNKIEEIKKYCKDNDKKFEYLYTPAQYPTITYEEKLKSWKNVFGR